MWCFEDVIASAPFFSHGRGGGCEKEQKGGILGICNGKVPAAYRDLYASKMQERESYVEERMGWMGCVRKRYLKTERARRASERERESAMSAGRGSSPLRESRYPA